MAEQRINPETGVLEEYTLGAGWNPRENSDGRIERINVETGVLEEYRLWQGWDPRENSDGRIERVNVETGVHEEAGLWEDWNPRENSDGRIERVNVETGVHEEAGLWEGWNPRGNSDGRIERVNVETGVHEEAGLWEGWQPCKGPDSNLAAPLDQARMSTAADSSKNSSRYSYESDSSYSSDTGLGGGYSGADGANSGSKSGAGTWVIFVMAGVAAAAWCVSSSMKTDRRNEYLPDHNPADDNNFLAGEQYPQTRTRHLTLAEVSSLNNAQLSDAINEMFARHGAVFNTSKNNKHFRQFQWYHPRPGLSFDQIQSEFINIEKANLELMCAERASRRHRIPESSLRQRTKQFDDL